MKMVISVGSNMGNPIENVESALKKIEEKFSLQSRSSLYRSSPVGGPEQSDFINAVAIVDSELAPLEVLEVLQAIEREFGRVRDVRWGPRTLDLDLIEVAGITNSDESCLLPHPRAHQRAFVLLPWLEVDPEAELTGIGKVREIQMPDQEVERI